MGCYLVDRDHYNIITSYWNMSQNTPHKGILWIFYGFNSWWFIGVIIINQFHFFSTGIYVDIFKNRPTTYWSATPHKHQAPHECVRMLWQRLKALYVTASRRSRHRPVTMGFVLTSGLWPRWHLRSQWKIGYHCLITSMNSLQYRIIRIYCTDRLHNICSRNYFIFLNNNKIIIIKIVYIIVIV